MQLKSLIMLTGTALMLGAGVFVPQAHVNVSASTIQSNQSTNQQLVKTAFDAVNAVRIKHHLKPLTKTTQDMAAASVRAKQISKHFSHYKEDGKAYIDAMHLKKSLIAENISYINNTSESDATNIKTSINDMYYHDGGINLWGHRKNFLNKHATHMGVGIYMVKNHTMYLAFTITN